MNTRLWLIVVGWLIATPAAAQFLGPPQNITVVDSGTACVTAPAACATFAVSISSSLALDISGTWTGTLTFEGSANDGAWRTILMTKINDGTTAALTTSNGTFSIANAGLVSVRVRATASVTGSALVTATRGYAMGLGNGSGGGGSGSPGGVSSAVQFKINASTFGGSNWLATAPDTLAVRPSDYLTENGPLAMSVGSAAHAPGERRDDIFSVGWNVGNVASAKGSTALVFEAHCGVSVGCMADGGQSETYFAMDDGMGHQVRPIGMFGQQDGSGVMSGIFRFDDLAFMDREQTFVMFSITDGDGIGDIRIANSIMSADAGNTDVFMIGGHSAMALEGGVLEYGRGSSTVYLSPGGDGSGIVRAASNHFQVTGGTIEDHMGNIIFRAGSDGPFPVFSGIAADAEVSLLPSSAAANSGMHIFQKGSGWIRLDSGGSGSVYLNTNHLLVGDFPGSEGVTASGTACAITAITHGVITAATCTP